MHFWCSKRRQQGAILSSILFCVSFDGLLCRLRDSGVGCVVGSIFAGALAYADDLTLLSHTPRAMRTLLSICENYASEFDIFLMVQNPNVYLSRLLDITPNHSGLIRSLRSAGRLIEHVEERPHFGHIISVYCKDEHDIINPRNRM
jgi:hypothetical protein